MRALGSVLFLLLRLLCYAALAVVVLGFGSVILLSVTGACSRIDTGGIVCISETYRQLGEFGMGVMLTTVLTGVPAVLALAGVFFLARKIYRRRVSATAHPLAAGPAAGALDDRSAPNRAPAKPGPGTYALKGLGVLVGIALLFGLIAGISGGGQ